MERTQPVRVDADLLSSSGEDDADIDHIVTCGCGDLVGIPSAANRRAICHNCGATVRVDLLTNDFEDRRSI
jgi:hypothetical protein